MRSFGACASVYDRLPPSASVTASSSDAVHSLLHMAAHSGATRHWRSMRASDHAGAVGAIAWLLRRRWGVGACRAAARLLLDRLEYVGAGAVAAAGRRETARCGAAEARRAAAWLCREGRGGRPRPCAWP